MTLLTEKQVPVSKRVASAFNVLGVLVLMFSGFILAVTYSVSATPHSWYEHALSIVLVCAGLTWLWFTAQPAKKPRTIRPHVPRNMSL